MDNFRRRISGKSIPYYSNAYLTFVENKYNFGTLYTTDFKEGNYYSTDNQKRFSLKLAATINNILLIDIYEYDTSIWSHVIRDIVTSGLPQQIIPEFEILIKVGDSKVDLYLYPPVNISSYEYSVYDSYGKYCYGFDTYTIDVNDVSSFINDQTILYHPGYAVTTNDPTTLHCIATYSTDVALLNLAIGQEIKNWDSSGENASNSWHMSYFICEFDLTVTNAVSSTNATAQISNFTSYNNLNLSNPNL